MVLKGVRARYSNGVFEPLDEVDLAEDQEVLLTVDEKPSPKRDPEAMRAGAGGWVGQHDPEELKRMLYEARITGSREPPGDLAPLSPMPARHPSTRTGN